MVTLARSSPPPPQPDSSSRGDSGRRRPGRSSPPAPPRRSDARPAPGPARPRLRTPRSGGAGTPDRGDLRSRCVGRSPAALDARRGLPDRPQSVGTNPVRSAPLLSHQVMRRCVLRRLRVSWNHLSASPTQARDGLGPAQAPQYRQLYVFILTHRELSVSSAVTPRAEVLCWTMIACRIGESSVGRSGTCASVRHRGAYRLRACHLIRLS